MPLPPQRGAPGGDTPYWTSSNLRAPGSTGVPRVGAGPGRRRRAGACPAPQPRRALGAHPWVIPCSAGLLAQSRSAQLRVPRAGGSVRSDPGASTDAGRSGGRSGCWFPAPPGASREPSKPCSGSVPLFTGKGDIPTGRESQLGGLRQPAQQRNASSVTFYDKGNLNCTLYVLKCFTHVEN